MTKARSRKEYPADPKIGLRLGAKLEQSLLAYATAATSAGVGFLALTCPAEAKIIYTHANEQISPNRLFPLDLNHDKKRDFTFDDSHATTSLQGAWGILTIFPGKSANEIWGYLTSNGFRRMASALPAGVSVGPKGKFSPGERIMLTTSASGLHRQAATSSRCVGPWKNATNRYLGLKFIIDGKPHYGWARLNVSCSNVEVLGTLTGYAYETVPNKPIITGKTKDDAGASGTFEGADDNGLSGTAPTLGRLAQGAAGLSTRRGEQDIANPSSADK
jgi:hypothetical protein